MQYIRFSTFFVFISCLGRKVAGRERVVLIASIVSSNNVSCLVCSLKKKKLTTDSNLDMTGGERINYTYIHVGAPCTKTNGNVARVSQLTANTSVELHLRGVLIALRFAKAVYYDTVAGTTFHRTSVLQLDC